MREPRQLTLAALAIALPLALAAGTAHAQQKVSVAPNPINCGGAPLNTPTAPTMVTVSNIGNAQLVVNNVSIDPMSANPGDFAVQLGGVVFAVKLNAGTNFAVNVVCTPRAMGLRQANLIVASNDPNTPSLSIPMTCTSGNPAIMLDTGTAAFGNQRVNVASMAQLITITNSGFGDLVVSKITMGGAMPGDFMLNPMMAVGTLKPMTSQQFSVVFKPLALGPRGATVTINSNDPMAPTKTVALLGTGTMAMPACDKKMIDFGNARVFQASMPKPVNLTNGGSDAYNVTKVTFDGPMGNYFNLSLAPSFPARVDPMKTLVLNVVAIPLMLGPCAATMTIVTDDPVVPMCQVALTAVGVGGAEMVSPAFVDFGTVALNPKMPPTAMITITNSGTDTLSILDNAMDPQMRPFIDGNNPEGFAVTNFNGMPVMMGATPMLPVMIAPKMSVTFTVSFAPSAMQDYSAYVNLLTDDTKAKLVRVPLDGKGGVPGGLTSNVMALNFGTSAVGTPAMPQSFVLSNTGGGPAKVTMLTIAGPAGTDYTADQMGPFTVDAGKTQTVNVIFTPSISGTRLAEADITVEGMMMPVVVKLQGSGALPKIAFSPNALAFGNVMAGTSSPAQMVTILNSGTSPVTITDITSSDPDFTVDKTAALQTVAPAAMVSFPVTFTPASTGNYMGTISVLARNAAMPVAMIPATGVGIGMRPKQSCSMAGRDTPLGFALLAGAAVALLLRRRRR